MKYITKILMKTLATLWSCWRSIGNSFLTMTWSARGMGPVTSWKKLSSMAVFTIKRCVRTRWTRKWYLIWCQVRTGMSWLFHYCYQTVLLVFKWDSIYKIRLYWYFLFPYIYIYIFTSSDVSGFPGLNHFLQILTTELLGIIWMSFVHKLVYELSYSFTY